MRKSDRNFAVFCLFSMILALVWTDREAQALPPAPSGSEWREVWGDEFDGESVDESKWNIQHESNYGSGNHEDQCYMRQNVSVSDGLLRLRAKRETVQCGNATNPDTGDATYYFTSGMITTRQQQGEMKFSFTRGYIEARIRTPKGNPYWSAFWLPSPADGSTPGWPEYGEFDIAELYGKRPDQTTGTFHYACTPYDHCKTSATEYNVTTRDAYPYSGNRGAIINSQESFDAYDDNGGILDFHDYGFLWEEDRITWYIDGEPFRYFDGQDVVRFNPDGSTTNEGAIGQTNIRMGESTVPFETMLDYPHSIILNLAVGGNGPRYDVQGDAYTGQEGANGFDDGNFVATMPASMDVDYVRVYQLEPMSGESDTGSDQPDTGGLDAGDVDANNHEPRDVLGPEDTAGPDATEPNSDAYELDDAQSSGDIAAPADVGTDLGDVHNTRPGAAGPENQDNPNADSGCGCTNASAGAPVPFHALLALLFVGLSAGRRCSRRL